MAQDPSPPIRILLVEDDPRDADLTRERFELAELNVDIVLVDNEADYLRALDSFGFDLILSDFHLPHFSGSEALHLAREHSSQVPFIFVSGVLGEEHVVDMLKQGATDYVLKQRLERLPLVVRRALAESRERQSRRDAERKLHDRETYFSQVIDGLRDYSVCTLSRDGRIESWNRASEWLFGYTADEMLGQQADVLLLTEGPGDMDVPDPATHWPEISQLGSKAEDRWLVRKNGSHFYGSVVTTAIFDDDGNVRGFSRIVRDMTDSRVAADLLQAAKEQAEAANRAKDHFLAVLSHELRTPLGPIYAAAQALDLQRDLPRQCRRSVELIKRNVEVEARLIDDLLDISKIVNDKLTLHLEPIDLVPLLGGMADLFRDEAAAREITLAYDPPAEPVIVQGDAARLQQIVWNLLKNAIKFTQKGQIRITLRRPVPGQITVDVADTGVGIHHDALKRIFNAFDQGSDDASQHRGGLGLGLAIASSLAQRHGGTLQVHSDGVGKGATFTLTLDDPSASLDASLGAKPAQASAINAPSEHILLVEDNADTAEAMQYLLEEFGYRIDVATSVADAHRRMAVNRYDILVSDMGLPDGDGIDVLNRFDRSEGQLAVALTGYGMEADVQRCLGAGFTEHLIKPLDIDRLLQVLRGV